MALNTKYEVGINLNDYFVDKDTGLPLAGGKIYFKKDNNRSVGKFVYMLTGSPPNYTYTALPNPITLSSVGTVAVSPTDATNVAVYFYPYDENGDLDLYFVQVRDADGNIQLEREAWPNISANVNPLNQVSGESDNQIANSQFVDILFEQEYGVTLSWTGAIVNQVFPLAPGWDMIVSASGTSSIEVNRIELAGSLNINTNPPYALDVLPEGDAISSIKLRQTLQGNPSIFANNTLSGFMLIASLDGLSHNVSMNYSTSVPDVPRTVISAATGTSGYVNAVGTLDVGASLNTATAPDAATYIDIILPRTGHIALSSIQILPITEGEDAASYIQDSVQRQESYLSYYYNPLIQQVPVPNILEGWDFRVNPAQWGNDVSVGAVASKYLWDQLIGWQSVNSCLRSYRTTPAALLLEHEAVAGQVAIIQYLSGSQLRQLLSNDFSVLMKGYTDRVGGASGTVSFWYTTDATLPNVADGTNLSLISTLDANGKPATFHGAWTELTRNYRGDARFTVPYSASDTYQNIPLEGWNNPGNTINHDATYGAIVIGFEVYSDFHNIVFESISCTPGLLARPYAPLSYNLTLAQLQYYYQKSYGPDINPGAVTEDGCYLFDGFPFDYAIVDSVIYGGAFGFQYTTKRAVPVPRFWTIGGVADSVRLVLVEGATVLAAGNVAISNFGVTTYHSSLTAKANTTTPLVNVATAPPSGAAHAYCDFQCVLDSRLGIVL